MRDFCLTVSPFIFFFLLTKTHIQKVTQIVKCGVPCISTNQVIHICNHQIRKQNTTHTVVVFFFFFHCCGHYFTPPGWCRTLVSEMDPELACKWTNKVVSPSCLGHCLGAILFALIFSSGFCWEKKFQFSFLRNHGYPKPWQRGSPPSSISYNLCTKRHCGKWALGIAL